VPGLLEFYTKVTDKMKKYPELIPTNKYFEMTREE
jgi:hypothetical protein